MEFKSYSHTRLDLKEEQYPSLELESWNEIKCIYAGFLAVQLNDIWLIDSKTMLRALKKLHLKYRRIDFGFYLCDNGYEYSYSTDNATGIALNPGLDDFFFYEMLSIYFNEISKMNYPSNKVIDKIYTTCESIFSQFGVNMMIKNNQFIPRQSEKITKEIYDPTFNLLNDSSYNGINHELNEAFGSYTAKNYEDVITKSINAVHAAMQILVDGEVNQKKKLNVLLKEAQKNKLLSDYELTTTIYSNINSYLERIRKDKAGVHPTEKKASQEDALFVLNLTMVLLQNIITNHKAIKG